MNNVSKTKRVQRHLFSCGSMGQRCLAVARATSAMDLNQLLWTIAIQYGPKFAAELLGTRWGAVGTRRATHRMLRRLINRLANVGLEGQERACRIIGRALMTTAESAAHRIVIRNTRHQLYRLTDTTHFTGWFRSREEARSQWPRSTPPIAVDTMMLNAAHILAVKLTANGFSEVIPEPGQDNHFEREYL